ncbi:hypothetical protein DLAC_10151 [Tieghemostelium lacteum]|uniref:Paramecium surface antigen repeat-containing protein n=1 Tax=Tieghemostelium lacteum TaxID=361077 RepID=A0A151Z6C0_TIELA|nr:hypothetical protein DLAC_10151 [Tieghemostelium lacteum]|eukprot:KYQ89477.1 hypothetical protein DLAC_10151 [Tieghemostelium lacteum]
MKSIIILLVTLISLNLIYSQACVGLSCAVEGGKCTYDVYPQNIFSVSVPGRNDNEMYCQSGYYCNLIDLDNDGYGVCAKLGELGDACPSAYKVDPSEGTTSGYAYPGASGCQMGMVCYEGSSESPYTCQYVQYAMLGEECDSNYQCAYPLECVGEVCQLQNQTQQTLNQCNDDVECPASKFCSYKNSPSTCVDRIAVGGTCSGTECTANAVCTEEGICRAIYSSPVGEVCLSTFETCDISQDIFCNAGICQKIQPDVTSSNCSDPLFAGCGDIEQCTCESDGFTGKCQSMFYATPSQCKTSTLEFLSCLVTNNCGTVFNGVYNPIAPDSCAVKYCSANICNMLGDCGQKYVNTCNVDPLLATICSSSSYVTFSIALLFIIAIIYLI